jgi:putative transcriptional regulator
MRYRLDSAIDFGALVRERRKSQGLTQQALADAMGVTRLWVSQFENGHEHASLTLALRAMQQLGLVVVAHEPRVASDSTQSPIIGPDLDSFMSKFGEQDG